MSREIHRAARATVEEILSTDAAVQLLRVSSASFSGKAFNYPPLTGAAEAGDEVLINTTAVELSLGTGGVHFVIANLSRESSPVKTPGHIMKLRYTPHQTPVHCVEEEDHPDHHLVRDFESLNGKPVILGMLHSMVAPAAAGVHAALEATPPKVAYIMTDSAALPLAFSSLVRTMKDKGLLQTTVTCGQAFGGDRETVNVYTALMAASDADVIVVAPGPGHVGAGTRFGFSGIELGQIVDIVKDLGGEPILIPRLSFADSRERHRGVSHHTITILIQACHSRATVVLPALPDDQAEVIDRTFQEHLIYTRHTVVVEDGRPALKYLNSRGIEVKSMGRSPEEDPAFFLAAGATGAYAASALTIQDRELQAG